MTTFQDAEKRTWQVGLTVDSIKRVKALLQVDLTEPLAGEPPLMTRLALDVILLCDVLFALVKPQADAAGVTDEQFGASLGGEAIIAAHDALMEAWVDFFRNLRRTHLVTAIEKQAELVRAAVAAGEKRLAALDPAAKVAAIFGEPSTSRPASSASILAP